MAPSDSKARPILRLREHLTGLEAAIALCLADPKPKCVHQIRTATRRIEADLILLGLLRGLPNHAKPAAKVQRLLRKLRRVASRVRDMDVQRDLLQPTRQSEARALRRHLKHQRHIEASHLHHVLKTLDPTVLERLQETLSSAESMTLSSRQLAKSAEDWFAQQTADLNLQTETDEDRLHAIRKAAKLARYMAESAPVPQRIAQHFERIQQLGGEWHDFLALAHTSKRFLGAKSPLTISLISQRDHALTIFRESCLPA
jgi:CHAD domain-containing protein